MAVPIEFVDRRTERAATPSAVARPICGRGVWTQATSAVFVLLLGTVFGAFWWKIETSPIPCTLNRVAWVALMAAVVVGQGRRLRYGGLAYLRRLRTADGVLIAFLAVLFVSAAIQPADTRMEALARWLFFYVLPGGLYWAAASGRITPASKRWIDVVTVGFGVYLGITAVFEVAGLSTFVFPRYIASSVYEEFFGRARGPLLNPVGNGLLLTWAGATAWTMRRRERTVREALVWAAMGIIAVGLFATLTRSVWLGAAAVIVVWFAVEGKQRGRAILAAAGCLAVILVALGFHKSLLSFKRDRNLSAADAAKSVELRPVLAWMALRVFSDHPLTGIGLARYDVAKFDYLGDRNSPFPPAMAEPYTQHNVFLSLLVETGVVGLGLFVLFLAICFREAWETWKSRASPPALRAWSFVAWSLILAYAINGMFHDVGIIPQVNCLLLTVLGCRRGLSAAVGQPPT
ncbi:MAG: O-antigen ligase family protein [Planctomycetota bacterium]|nr:MAG: O-antigen ligase family protein [Planctomycetota bacterium]